MTDASPKRDRRLLAEFPVPDLGQWRAEVERLLKGVPFAKAMLTRTLEGLTIQPMPTAAETRDLPWIDALPGQVPYSRGSRPGGRSEAPWLVAQEIPLPLPADFNAALRHDLQRGQTAVHLVLDAAGQAGQDPLSAAAGAVGASGTSVADLQDLQAALEGVDPAGTPVMTDGGAAALPLAAMLALWWEGAEVAPGQRCGFLGCDPVAGLAQQGRLPVPMGRLYDDLALITGWAADAPRVRTLPVRETIWHEGGAHHALSLGLTLSGALHLLREMEARGIAPDAAVARVHFHICVDTDFFMSLAKLRALRLLWSGVQAAAGLEPLPAFIHARTGGRMMAAVEPYPNLLRVTTATMAAVLGGADSIQTGCFDRALGLPDEFSRRLARNVPLILAHEVHLDKVADPAGGAWYPERLTADLAARAWEHARAVEQAGGIVAVLESGWVQERIAAVAAERRRRLAVGKDAMVGVNRYCDPQASPMPSRKNDDAGIEAARKAELDGRAPWGSGLATGFDGMIQAVRAGARLGALIDPGPDDLMVDPVPARRDAEPFEAIRQRVLSGGDLPATRVCCACLGDPARYMPRLDFVRGFFASGGFQVLAHGHHDTAAAAVAAAQDAGAATVVLVGLDDTYARLATETARGMAALAPPLRIILAGKPGTLEDELRAAGVAEFLHARSDMLDVLGRLAGAVEVTS